MLYFAIVSLPTESCLFTFRLLSSVWWHYLRNGKKRWWEGNVAGIRRIQHGNSTYDKWVGYSVLGSVSQGFSLLTSQGRERSWNWFSYLLCSGNCLSQLLRWLGWWPTGTRALPEPYWWERSTRWQEAGILITPGSTTFLVFTKPSTWTFTSFHGRVRKISKSNIRDSPHLVPCTTQRWRAIVDLRKARVSGGCSPSPDLSLSSFPLSSQGPLQDASYTLPWGNPTCPFFPTCVLQI